MSDRTVSVKLLAEVSSYVANLRQAAVATRGVASDVKKMSATHTQATTDMGRAAAVGGAAVLGGLGLATKAAMNWESAWAGVTKTVNGSVSQMSALEAGIRKMATVMPATAEEIAGVAESAGQLGVARKDILTFSKTMIDLGQTTNLSADEAATSIAQMVNVMQVAPQDVGRLGATLVALGNDGASTERDIIQMSQRIAGAAATVGLSADQVLALSNAVASMGIDAEAGGSSVSRILTDMSKAAQSGGKELDVFAQTAGMSAGQFSTAFKDKPAQAFASFISGLGGIQDAGGNVFAVLDNLGLSDVRVSQALLGMASSGDLLTRSLTTGSKAWADNTALTDEAAKRYATSAARIQVAQNKIHDAAIEVGDSLLPAVAGAAEKVGDLASAFAGLPGPVRKSAAAVTAVGGAAALTGGAMLVLLPKIVETKKAIDTLNLSSAAGAARLGALAKAGVAIGAVTATVGGLQSVYDKIEGLSPETSKLAVSLEQLGQTGKASGEAARLLGGDLGELGSAMSTLKSERGTLREVWDFGAVFSPGDSQWGEATKRVEALDSALSSMAASGNTKGAALAFQQVSASADSAGVSGRRLAELFPQYTSAASAAESVTSTLASTYSSDLSPAVVDAQKALDAYSAALGDTVAIDAYTATANLAKSFKELKGSLKDAGSVTNDEKIALGGFASDVRRTSDAVLSLTGSQEKSSASMGRGRAKFMDLAEAAGYSRKEARRLTDQLLAIPARTDITIDANTAPALRELAGLRATIQSSGVSIPVSIGVSNKVARIPVGKAAGGMVDEPDYRIAAGGAVTGPAPWSAICLAELCA